MNDALLTTRDVAALMGVGATSVKRWADAGVLRCVKTAGGHRRFLRSEVDRFIQSQAQPEESSMDPFGAEAWLRLFKELPDVFIVQGKLLEMRAQQGCWWRVADQLGRLLVRLGHAWREGEMSVLEEHVATEALHRAVSVIGSGLPVRHGAPRVMLANAPGDDHTLGLSLAELTAREAGWATLWAGRRAPVDELVQWAKSGRISMLAVSASPWSTDAESLRHVAEGLAQGASDSSTRLVLGGGGAWPESIAGATRVWSMEQFHATLT